MATIEELVARKGVVEGRPNVIDWICLNPLGWLLVHPIGASTLVYARVGDHYAVRSLMEREFRPIVGTRDILSVIVPEGYLREASGRHAARDETLPIAELLIEWLRSTGFTPNFRKKSKSGIKPTVLYKIGKAR